MKACHRCGAPWKGLTQPGSKETCAGCGADLHCCAACRHYDTHKPSACMVPDIDPVMDKERFNFCEDFQLAGMPGKSAEASAGETDSAKKAFNNLFRKK